eukprot:CAMPEP_0118883738 /NCGR_PEP_ID=MMETSP1163-20130328/22744_1 /TAXON_ID=124430 /ORGANISM="Phaeomonas parva, Strain CCMP2877" /LENGTH=153 /DNA_ID=CAMNT_0006821275 /DNA_START=156 /DNA_END=613 /DNA_ORIENTATION=-
MGEGDGRRQPHTAQQLATECVENARRKVGQIMRRMKTTGAEPGPLETKVLHGFSRECAAMGGGASLIYMGLFEFRRLREIASRPAYMPVRFPWGSFGRTSLAGLLCTGIYAVLKVQDTLREMLYVEDGLAAKLYCPAFRELEPCLRDGDCRAA